MFCGQLIEPQIFMLGKPLLSSFLSSPIRCISVFVDIRKHCWAKIKAIDDQFIYAYMHTQVVMD